MKIDAICGGYGVNFDKKVIYLSYVENGIKGKSAGYIRIEKRDDSLSMDMHVNVKRPEEGKFEVLAETNTQAVPIGVIILQNGVGNYRGQFVADEIGKKGAKVIYDDIEAFKVLLGNDGYILGSLGTVGVKEGVPPNKEFVEAAEVKASQEQRYNSDQKQGNQYAGASGLEIHNDNGPDQDRPKQNSGNQDVNKQNSKMDVAYDNSGSYGNDLERTGRNNTVITQDDDIRKNLEEVRQTPDKWQQLLKSYKQVHPYGDERVYLSIEPKDFVIMSGEYQHLAHNSFLLHGFYNYRHIIMGEENNSIYLGVPGVFYEREKMVAMMFGFEAFECEGGKAENGKFGYYLKKVKI
jgi:hypothetical protein